MILPKVLKRVKRKQVHWALKTRMEILAWAFLLPITFLHFIVVVYPILQGIRYSFSKWSGFGEPEFIGLANFHRLFFEDRNFWNAFNNNLLWMTFFLTVPFIIALLASSVLARVKRGSLFYRAALFIPYVLPPVAVAFIWRMIYSPGIGLGGQLSTWLGIPGLDIAYLGRGSTALWAVAFAAGWAWWGFLMVLFLTAIQAISVDLYDAAKVDGANLWGEFVHVTLPGIRPTVFFMLMITTATIFASFQYVFILTGGGPAGTTELVATFLYKQAFERYQMGYASAIGLTVAALAAIIIAGFNLMRRLGWDV
jgi:raffinose/stachyose/melibiose transport system permease protein